MLKYLNGKRPVPVVSKYLTGQPLVTLLVAGVVFYIAWLLGQSVAESETHVFLRFIFNGLVVGAIYAMVALGFTMVYGTVWFFDLSYGAMATMGAYTVFYFLPVGLVGGTTVDDVNNVYLDIVMGILIAGVAGWVLYTWLYPRLRSRTNPSAALVLGSLLALGAGAYTGLFLANPRDLNIYLSPIIGLLTAIVIVVALYRGLYVGLGRPEGLRPLLALGVPGALALGAFCGFLVARTSGSILYLSWGVGALLAGATGLVLYRGIYFYMRRRASSPLIMLVGSLGILLAATAFIAILFTVNGKALADPFGTDPWNIGRAFIKPFQVFFIGMAFILFIGLHFLLKKTSFGKAVRAISDDEEVAKIVGINTTVVIAAIFFIGAAIAALGGIFRGHDTSIVPPMGFALLLKGWIASVVGGIGNIYGALLGGFVLGLVENFGIWYLDAVWMDAISFVLLILFLAFWPRGLLPRK
ncbi:MAG: branched-chain amino acid ABC transporter permease [Dehalococcoidia bacterium]